MMYGGPPKDPKEVIDSLKSHAKRFVGAILIYNLISFLIPQVTDLLGFQAEESLE
jgi:hypothetical protein